MCDKPAKEQRSWTDESQASQLSKTTGKSFKTSVSLSPVYVPRPSTDPSSRALTLRIQTSLSKACPHSPGQTHGAMPRWQMEGRERERERVREKEHLAWFKQCHGSAAVSYLFYLLSTRTGSVVTSGNIAHFMSDSHPITTAASVCFTAFFFFFFLPVSVKAPFADPSWCQMLLLKF